MSGLAGNAAKIEAARLATLYDVSANHIYRMTQDLRRGARKTRSDKGKRTFEIVPGTDVFEAAALVVGAKLDPDQALLTAQANGLTNLPSLYTMQRLLNENGLNRKRRNTGRRNHNRFEADAPLGLIQIDCTALKVRWKDIKTRRILRIDGVDKNHPQMDRNKLRVWQIMALDDHSRRRFLRYVACGHITSRDMVAFCCELFCEWGLPLKVYTDNGPEFKGFFAKAISIINAIPAIAESGGCEHLRHMPNNPQASGKVENAHRWAEKMDRYVGLAEQKALDIDEKILNKFADTVCRDYNEVHVPRSTGQTPMARWFGTQITQRMLPAAVVRAALLFDEAERKVADDMTVEVARVKYRLPVRDENGKAAPWRQGTRLSVIVPHELNLIFVTLENGDEYEVEKVVASAHAAGEYKTAAETDAEQLAKQLKAHHAEQNKRAREQKKATGEEYQVPFYNHEIAAAETNITHFPQKTMEISADELASVVPVPMDQQSSPPYEGGVDAALGGRGGSFEPNPQDQKPKTTAYEGKPLTFWQAVNEFKHLFATLDEAKAFLAAGLYPEQAGEIASTVVEAAIQSHQNPKEEVKLRLAG